MCCNIFAVFESLFSSSNWPWSALFLYIWLWFCARFLCSLLVLFFVHRSHECIKSFFRLFSATLCKRQDESQREQPVPHHLNVINSYRINLNASTSSFLHQAYWLQKLLHKTKRDRCNYLEYCLRICTSFQFTPSVIIVFSSVQRNHCKIIFI